MDKTPMRPELQRLLRNASNVVRNRLDPASVKAFLDTPQVREAMRRLEFARRQLERDLAFARAMVEQRPQLPVEDDLKSAKEKLAEITGRHRNGA